VIRTFLAVDLDGELLDEVAALASRLRGGAVLSGPGVRWVDRSAMHVTLRFFGSTTDEQLVTQRALVSELAVPAAPTERVVRAASLTGFPDAHRARIVVVELAAGSLLDSLAQRAESAARAMGFEAESRAYRPHLTLARSKAPRDITALSAAPLRLPAGRIESLTLYGSETGPKGPIYTPLASRPLHG